MERREVMRIRVWEKESSPGNEDDASTEDAFGENCIAAIPDDAQLRYYLNHHSGR